MDASAVNRFLELVARELDADEAHLRIGGRKPEGPLCVCHEAGHGSWVVVTFSKPPQNRGDAEERLSVLCRTFRATIEAAVGGVPFSGNLSDVARHRLDQELGALAKRAGAVRAAVFDLDSPVIWGASAPDAPAAEANQALERAVRALREQHGAELRKQQGHTLRIALEGGPETIVRPFASIYVLALLFSGPVSEPIALGAVLHAAQLIERLVLALPPIDPDPSAKVIRLRR